MSGKCDSCMVDGHDTCWDDKPDRTCSCCLDTWFGMLCEPTRTVAATEVKATDLIDALRHLKGSEELWCEGGWAV